MDTDLEESTEWLGMIVLKSITSVVVIRGEGVAGGIVSVMLPINRIL